MSAVVDAVVITAAGVLLTVTVLHNAGRNGAVVNALHAVGLVPQWTFFAPVPGTQNLYLLYRDVYPDGQVSAWRVVDRMDAYRSPWTCLWNPSRRLRKALHDVVTRLPYDQAEHTELFKLSTPYLLILNHIAGIPRLDGAVATGFMIMGSCPNEPARMAFCSELHRL
ncbi:MULTISPECIES: hypothetical protein [Mycolicibacterium]|jgi:hypothetical protein|nr:MULTISPECIES: hypothetical protein [Mycolicibacterium]RUP36902.1 MAG: hypothetical protein EKK60_13880 [Gordonia sp. (in: high G+C Gram-positive bacteria)]MDW5610316.1 hypothetical protein [Mycolicibacterium sp. D5.8-2]PQP39649.1 hypothetical protein C6A88_32545 [Mycolicibacterium austroafricanum]QZY48766.1 hypothetical protein K5L12_14395 [Mycolicibacterium austroafricanum]UJL27284.1 hypothetical protein HZU38_20430 [Mycolicibacterium vanbaalenii]